MTSKKESDTDQRLEYAVAIAHEAGEVTLKHFQDNALRVERKGDGSPVTVADRAAEELLRKRIAERFPQDAILGEEFGDQPGTSGFQWVLDPIDGTKSFIHGVPLYTTLVAVIQDTSDADTAEPLLGVIHAPATGETVFASTGKGCWFSRDRGQPQEASVSETSKLGEGLLLTSEVASFAEDRKTDDLQVYLDLQKKARLVRTWGDAYGYLMVATGRAEVMIDPAMSLWDAAALKPIVEEAGGRFTDWNGVATVHSGEAIATNGRLHDAVLGHTRNDQL